MRLIVYFKFILFYVSLTKASELATYITLIKQIRSYFSVPSVVFLYPNKSTHLDDMTLMYVIHAWSSALEHEQITTMTIPVKDMRMLERYHKNISRSLVISILRGPLVFREFSHNTKFISMSSFVWFIFVTDLPEPSFNCRAPQGNPFHLSFDTEMLVFCPHDPILREWYSLDGKTTEVFDLFKRSEATKESPIPIFKPMTNLTLHERRHDLKGKVLRGVIVKNSMLITYENNKFKGYFTAVIKELENALNFTLKIVAEDLKYGSFNATTNRWEGAVHYIASKTLDIGVGDFAMTNVRLDYVEYLIPIIVTKSCLFVKQPEIFAVKWFAYFKYISRELVHFERTKLLEEYIWNHYEEFINAKAFSIGIWVFILLFFLISLYILLILKSRIGSCSVRDILYEEILQLFGIICQQSLIEFPRHTALKIAYFSIIISSYVVYSAYSASLIGFLTAYVPYVPFRTIDEFIQDNEYKVTVLRGSADYDMFLNSNDKWSIAFRKKMKPTDELPYDMFGGFNSVCESNKVAFYSHNSLALNRVMVKVNIPCKVICLNAGRMNTLSMILPKGSQYTATLNYYLQRFLMIGLLKRFQQETELHYENNFQPVGFGSVASGLFFFVVGVILSLLMLIVEIYCHKSKSIKAARRRNHELIR